MHDTWEFLKTLTNPESIILYGGLALLLFVIFAETGLMIGFFLPGDSLVFVSGLLCGTKPELLGIEIYTLILSMSIAAILGNVTGYYFGIKIGPALFTKDDNLIFKKKYVVITRSFYDRHGGKSLILGRFLPIIRTFAPILAGVIKMDLKIFLFHTVAGAILWIGSLSILGYYLGRIVWVKENVEWFIFALLILTTIPFISTYMKERLRKEG
ncbi:MAG: VTT domain-containing protein [Bacteroidetes bacterium]|nr:VTT domain-containing protein [Bacteroidota bacterium]